MTSHWPPGRHRKPVDVGQDLEQQLQAAVGRAAAHYGAGRYGRGEYELVRLGLTIARHYGDAVAAEALAGLRFIQEPLRRVPPPPPPPPSPGVNPSTGRPVDLVTIRTIKDRSR